MQYRKLGKTGLNVSVIGYGASPLGNAFGEVAPQQGIAAVHRAIDQGINLFDVSPYYGLTLAETRLGEALERHRERVILMTKCGRYGMNEFDFSRKRIRRSVEESLARLRTDHVDRGAVQPRQIWCGYHLIDGTQRRAAAAEIEH